MKKTAHFSVKRNFKSSLAKNKIFNYLPLFFFFLTITAALAQESSTLLGVVTDETGTPLPGVNVVIEGKSIGTTTDFDGRYSIDVSDEDILVFSYLGFLTSKMPYNGQA